MAAHKPIHFPATREGALGAAKAFAPHMGMRYAKERNRVVPGHPYVSCLSPAIRVRLISESEVVQIALDEFGSLHRCEKFVQEVTWRNYWRTWLELHPEIWTHFLRSRDDVRADLSQELRERVEQLEAGNSGCEPMDNFARELVETGYLHNHARMWFAAYWVHTEQLPWQLGADFFDRHLIDSCSASNTLSWRWVIGLHSQGKSYLARRNNLEKWCDPAYLGSKHGVERLDNVTSIAVPLEPIFASRQPVFNAGIDELEGNVGLWITEDDLAPETHGELKDAHFSAICTSIMAAPHRSEKSNGLRRAYREEAIRDTAQRAQNHWGPQAQHIDVNTSRELAAQLGNWAESANIQTVVALKPFIGPLDLSLDAVRARLNSSEIKLVLLRRPEDVELLQYATAGFFKFWDGVKALARPGPDVTP